MQSALSGLLALEESLDQQQPGPLSPTPLPPDSSPDYQGFSPAELSTSASSLPASETATAAARQERHSRKLLETATSATQGKAVRSHLLTECDERIAALESELDELKRRLRVAKRGSRQERLEHDEVERMLAVKGQEASQLAGHKLDLESMVYHAGVVSVTVNLPLFVVYGSILTDCMAFQATVEQQATIEAIRKRMDIEMAHAALMLEESESQRRRMEWEAGETTQQLSQAKQQLSVAKSFAAQLESRTSAVQHKLRMAERRRLEAEQALVHSRRALQTQGSSASGAAVYPPSALGGASGRPGSPGNAVKDVLAEMAKRRLEQQLTQASQALDAQMAELEELKDLKRQWQIGTQEFAPDGTRLGQDVPDFEDTADHGPHASPAAPAQPQPLNAGPPPVKRPSSAHPKLGGGASSRGGGGGGDGVGSGGSLDDMLLTEDETSLAKEGDQLSISLGERGAFKRVLQESKEKEEAQQQVPQRPSSAFARPGGVGSSSQVSFDATAASAGPPFINRGAPERSSSSVESRTTQPIVR